MQIGDRIKLSDIKSGDVILWHGFPYQRDEEIKDRWFVYIGRTGKFDIPFLYYLQTTTTQKDAFTTGNRKDHKTVKLAKGETPFAKDCLIDLTELPQKMTLEMDLKFCADFEYKGRLPDNKIREILKVLKTTTAPIYYKDICNALAIDGFKI